MIGKYCGCMPFKTGLVKDAAMKMDYSNLPAPFLYRHRRQPGGLSHGTAAGEFSQALLSVSQKSCRLQKLVT